MAFALVLRELLKHWRLLVVGILLAAAAAVFSVYQPDGFTLKPRGLKHSSASTQVFVDTPSSSLGDLAGSFEPLNIRASVYANFMTTPAVLELLGQYAHIPWERIYAAGPVDPNLSKTVQEPTALKRNVEIAGETEPYRLNYTTDSHLPTVGIDAQAPTTSQAIALANGAVVALKEYVARLQVGAKVPPASRVVIRQVGTASGSVDDPGIAKTLAATVFIAVFLLWCVLVLLGLRFRENWRASAALQRAGDAPDDLQARPESAPIATVGEDAATAQMGLLDPNRPGGVGRPGSLHPDDRAHDVVGSGQPTRATW